MQKDEELDGGGLRLRSTQTENPAIQETPLVLEFRANITKLSALKQKVFGNASVKKLHIRSSLGNKELTAHKEVEPEVDVEEYASDDDLNEEIASTGSTEDGPDIYPMQQKYHLHNIISTLSVFYRYTAQHAPTVVSQINDILKSPSTQIEVIVPTAAELLPSLTMNL